MLSLTFFTAHTSLGCRKCLIGMLFDRKRDKLLSRVRVAAHVIFKVSEEDVMNDALFAPLSNYRERESQQAYKTLSCVGGDGTRTSEGWSLATLTSAKYV